MSIPGFSRYTAQWNEHEQRLIICEGEREINQICRKRGFNSVHLYDDTGMRRTLSVLTVACLAYHGQPPNGMVAGSVDGTLSLIAVRWMLPEKAMGYARRKIAKKNYWKCRELYFEKGLTQDAIAKRLGISQAQVCRIINQQTTF